MIYNISITKGEQQSILLIKNIDVIFLNIEGQLECIVSMCEES